MPPTGFSRRTGSWPLLFETARSRNSRNTATRRRSLRPTNQPLAPPAKAGGPRRFRDRKGEADAGLAFCFWVEGFVADLGTSQPAAASADFCAGSSAADPEDLALISRP